MLLAIILGIFAIGIVFIVYGTIVKNNWGINVDPVSCPRCNTPLPIIRKPRTLRQAMWGGGTCPVCGIDVDKWGREVASQGHERSPGSMPSNGQARKVLKRRFIIIAIVAYFSLTIIFTCLRFGPFKGSFPSTLVGWVVVIGTAAAETAVFTVLFYLVSIYVVGRYFFRDSERIRNDM